MSTSGTRPIPISSTSSSSRSRASPPSSSGSRGGSPDLGISHSCPVHAPLHPGGGSGRFQPPRAPFFGSLPEPSFLQLDDNPMPELVLPPPAHHRDGLPTTPSVVQFASSCPVDIGFMRQGHPTQRLWTPSPRALDEFDLSKSPALAVMSAAREGRAPTHNFRRVGQQQQQQEDENRHRPSSAGGSRRDSAGFYTELMGSLSITEEEQFSDDSADFNHHSYSVRRRLQQEAEEQLQEFRLPSSQPAAYDHPISRERRGSYGNLSDNGDGGVFLFEES